MYTDEVYPVLFLDEEGGPYNKSSLVYEIPDAMAQEYMDLMKRTYEAQEQIIEYVTDKYGGHPDDLNDKHWKDSREKSYQLEFELPGDNVST